MHYIKYLLALALYLDAYALTKLCEFIGSLNERLLHFGHVYNHHHVEILLHNGLRNVEDIDIVFSKKSAHFSNDTLGVLAYYCNDGSVYN